MCWITVCCAQTRCLSYCHPTCCYLTCFCLICAYYSWDFWLVHHLWPSQHQARQAVINRCNTLSCRDHYVLCHMCLRVLALHPFCFHRTHSAKSSLSSCKKKRAWSGKRSWMLPAMRWGVQLSVYCLFLADRACLHVNLMLFFSSWDGLSVVSLLNLLPAIC